MIVSLVRDRGYDPHGRPIEDKAESSCFAALPYLHMCTAVHGVHFVKEHAPHITPFQNSECCVRARNAKEGVNITKTSTAVYSASVHIF